MFNNKLVISFTASQNTYFSSFCFWPKAIYFWPACCCRHCSSNYGTLFYTLQECFVSYTVLTISYFSAEKSTFVVTYLQIWSFSVLVQSAPAALKTYCLEEIISSSIFIDRRLQWQDHLFLSLTSFSIQIHPCISFSLTLPARFTSFYGVIAFLC